MHIPDGYLSLQTSLPAFGIMAPIWSVAIRKIKKMFSLRQIPLLSLCAAFSFIIMMFNVPLGISSVHAVGSVFIAILIGPWAACFAVTIALVIQAFVFADGGALTVGVNCFNMAFAMPFAGYYVYKLLAGKHGILTKRGAFGAFMGGYIGINVAALLTAIEVGIQPIIFKTADGLPQFSFYPLSVAIPALMGEHLFIAGPIEGIITISALAYLAKYSPQMFDVINNYKRKASKEDFQGNNSLLIGKNKETFFLRYKSFVIGLLVLAGLTPLGLIATGTAWGEWSIDQIKKMKGFVPSGMERLSNIWSSIFQDYSIPGLNKGFLQSSTGYIISAVVGIFLIVAVTFISSRFISKKEDNEEK